MKIIVTGGAGFVGSHTIRTLQTMGYDTVCYDLKTGFDIRNLAQLESVIEKGDKVLHLAAVSRFEEADNDPLKAHDINVLGTTNVAVACKKKRAERLVYSSTGSVYMPVEGEPPITEKFKARGNSVYACTKYLGELVIKRIMPPHIILRYAHLYGEGRLHRGAVGAFLTRVRRGMSPVLYGGKQSNDFTYIKDVVQANVRALEAPNQHLNEVFNIGTGEELTTEKAFKIIAQVIKYDGEIKVTKKRSVDAERFVYDISKARNMLGYSPEFSFREGLKDYVGKIPQI